MVMVQKLNNVMNIVTSVLMVMIVLYVKMKMLKNQTVVAQSENIKKVEHVQPVQILNVKPVKEQISV